MNTEAGEYSTEPYPSMGLHADVQQLVRETEEAWKAYCDSMCQHGHHSAKAVVAYRHWQHLENRLQGSKPFAHEGLDS